ncbi:MAG: ATP-binding protein [Nitrospirales bacterium]
MPSSVESPLQAKQSTLQKILTSAVNELGMDAILVAIITHEGGPFLPQVSRGFSSREIRAILRTLSPDEWGKAGPKGQPSEAELNKALRLRMITPGSKVLLGIPLKHGGRIYGTLVLGRKESSTVSKRDKSVIERARTFMTEELMKAGLFSSSLILGRPLVAQEPIPADGDGLRGHQPRSYSNPSIQERVTALLGDIGDALPFERAWVTIYDPIAATLEVLGGIGNTKRDLVPGQRLLLDESASGWTVRHRKPRTDHNLASTQGRFQDYKQLYKDRFASTVVVPFFVRGRVAGTVTFASKTASQYDSDGFQFGQLEPVTTKLVELFEDPTAKLSILSEQESANGKSIDRNRSEISEPAIRREERRVALGEVSSFLATEIREPMGFIRAQLEEITVEATLDFDSQTRIETAMRDLIRVESILHEILDFAKPLQLDRRLCRVPELLDHALSLISTDVRVNRIEVQKEYPSRLAQVRWDDTKMRHAFLSIFKNSLEAMSPGGQLRVTVTSLKDPRNHIGITIENDGIPIPPEHVDKVFEPYFTTKRSGTGLGLAMVKKIVDEHQGQIQISSGPEQGTTVTLQMPALRPRVPYNRGRRHGTRRTPTKRAT